MGIAIEMHASHIDVPTVYEGAIYGEVAQAPAPLRCYESDEHSESSHDSNLVRLSSTDSENPLKLRESAFARAAGCKGQRMCCYAHCPSPLHSKKWRVVTAGTSAGNRDWAPLVGQTLCDSCYSTFRKHGTFIRSVRTNEGWFRLDSSGSQGSQLSSMCAGDKPKKSPQAAKRQRCAESNDSAHKHQDRKHVSGEDGPIEPRPSRSRKPSEKMKDMIQPTSGKRGRKAETFDGQHADVLPMHDAIPESECFDNTPAQLNEEHFEMSPADLACSSSEMCMNTLEVMEPTLFEEDLTSASDEELIDAILPPTNYVEL